jgi:hypothetical protein
MPEDEIELLSIPPPSCWRPTERPITIHLERSKDLIRQAAMDLKVDDSGNPEG